MKDRKRERERERERKNLARDAADVPERTTAAAEMSNPFGT